MLGRKSAPSDEGADERSETEGEKSRNFIYSAFFSPSVFCFAKSTSLVRGGKAHENPIIGIEPKIKVGFSYAY